MKILSGVFICLCVVIVCAKSKIRNDIRKRLVLGCVDVALNCALLNQQVHICTDAGAKVYAQQNCAKTCDLCFELPGIVSKRAAPMQPSSGADEDPFTLSFGTPAPTGCVDASTNCAMLNQQAHICTDAGAKIYAQQNCAMTCGMCSSSSGGGSTSCHDAINNCNAYDPSMCSNPDFKQWATQNCALTCHLCGTGPAIPMTAAPVTAPPMPVSGGCHDAINNCKSYDPSICTNANYKQWVTQNCALTCHMCGTGPVIQMTAAPVTSAPVTAAPMPVSGGCHDAINNCKSYDPSICTDDNYKQWVTQNCALTCHMCGSGPVISMTQAPMQPSGGGCHDTIDNCKAYDPSICTNPDYKQWVTEKCANTCNLCTSAVMPNTGGGGPGLATASPQQISGSTSGCVYNSHLYQQGETWKDGCKFSCQCVDGSTGKYQCTQLCVQWNLPAQCHLNPPAPGKCCTTPACPPEYQIQYPDGYTPQ